MQNVSSIIEYLLSVGESELVLDLIQEKPIFGIDENTTPPSFVEITNWGSLTYNITEKNISIFYQR